MLKLYEGAFGNEEVNFTAATVIAINMKQLNLAEMDGKGGGGVRNA